MTKKKGAKKLGKVETKKVGKKLGAVKPVKELTDNTDDQLRVIIRTKSEGWQDANALLTTRKNQAEIAAVQAQS